MTNPGISPAANEAIKHLLGSDRSEAIAVGETLWDIASNGDDAQTDTALIASAQAIVDSAKAFIDAVGQW